MDKSCDYLLFTPILQHKRRRNASVAYVVLQYYGLDVSDYSFGYVLGWSTGKDLKELKSSLETIRQTAQTIIKDIDHQLNTIKQSRQIDSGISRDTPAKAHKRHIRR